MTDFLRDSFGYTTAGTNEPPPLFFINPLCERGTLRLLGPVMLMVMFALRGLRAAMFAEPAITQIEEVGRLVHRAAFYIDQRLESGDSIKRTGTDIRLPSRQICT